MSCFRQIIFDIVSLMYSYTNDWYKQWLRFLDFNRYLRNRSMIYATIHLFFNKNTERTSITEELIYRKLCIDLLTRPQCHFEQVNFAGVWNKENSLRVAGTGGSLCIKPYSKHWSSPIIQQLQLFVMIDLENPGVLQCTKKTIVTTWSCVIMKRWR